MPKSKSSNGTNKNVLKLGSKLDALIACDLVLYS